MIGAVTEGLEVSRVNVLLHLKPVASIILDLDFFHENGLKAVSSHRFSLKRDIHCKKSKCSENFAFSVSTFAKTFLNEEDRFSKRCNDKKLLLGNRQQQSTGCCDFSSSDIGSNEQKI